MSIDRGKKERGLGKISREAAKEAKRGDLAYPFHPRQDGRNGFMIGGHVMEE